jgi:membrane protein
MWSANCGYGPQMATATTPSRRQVVTEAVPDLVRSFSERNLLLYASATAFNIFTAIIPALLFGLALLGFLDLKEVWTRDIAPDIEKNVSEAGFSVIRDTVDKVLNQKQAFWLTAGFLLAIWQVSGGIRTAMQGLNRIYDAHETRSWTERFRRSILLSLATSALILAAIITVWLGPLLYGDVGQPVGALLAVGRWVLAGAFLWLAVALTVRFAPDAPQQPAGWVTFGSVLVVATWILASLLFGLWIRYGASYGSVFGSLATVVVLIAYVYISTIVFFAGAQLDAIIRRRVEGSSQGS